VTAAFAIAAAADVSKTANWTRQIKTAGSQPE